MKPIIGGIGTLLFGKPKRPGVPLQARRDTAAEAAQNRDMLSQRKGAAANQLTGSLGAESAAGKKTNLGT